MKTNNLTAEIVKHILNRLGFYSENSSNLLFSDSFKTKKSINLEFEDNEKTTIPVWSCQEKINENILNLVYTRIIDNNIIDIYLVLQLNDQPIFGISFADSCRINLFFQNKWGVSSVYTQAQLLSGIELICSMNLDLEAAAPSAVLFEALDSLIESSK